MFEKIFGIFRKRKKADISQDIPGDIGEDFFNEADAEFGDDFDADTISLETGVSDGGLSTPSGDGLSGPEFGEAGVASSEPPVEEELGFGFDVEEEAPGAPVEEGISPLPEVEPVAFAPPKRKGRGKWVLTVIIVVLVGLAGGFVLSTPTSIEMIRRAISSEPTLLEQLDQLKIENEQLGTQLKAYRTVGTIDEIRAIKDELKKRNEMAADIKAVDLKIADRAAVEERLDKFSARLKQTEREMVIQKGALANVQKALKQIEARNNYFVTSTNMHLEQLEKEQVKSEVLKARLESERVMSAETRAYMSRDIQEGVERTAFEALSSSL